jgi:hypothetical protein
VGEQPQGREDVDLGGQLGRCRSVEARRGRTNFAFISMVFHGAGLNGLCVKPVVLLMVAMQAEIMVQARY